eukprot:COSAG02_NODE_607_length_19608_cov_33.568968_7_plen_71_part_00
MELGYGTRLWNSAMELGYGTRLWNSAVELGNGTRRNRHTQQRQNKNHSNMALMNVYSVVTMPMARASGLL